MAGLLGIGMNVGGVELGSLPVLPCLIGSARPVAGEKPGHNAITGVVLGRCALHPGRRARWLFFGSPAGWQDPKAPKKKSRLPPNLASRTALWLLGVKKAPMLLSPNGSVTSDFYDRVEVSWTEVI